MQRLQIFVDKSQGKPRVGLLRNPHHLGDLVTGPKRRVAILSPPLPSSEAYILWKQWQNRLEGPWGALWQYVATRKPRCPQMEASHSFAASYGDSPTDAVFASIKELLQGRLLSEQKILQVLRQDGFWPSDISRALDLGVYSGELLQFPGFTTSSWGRQICTRCQSEDSVVFLCTNCGKQDCLLCSACGVMGEHRSCSILLTAADQVHSRRSSSAELVLTYELTPAQEVASQELLDFWRTGEGKALVWAACGAGKTEVTFSLIQRALCEGGEVLFAIPRQDIVREMAERLSLAFPGITVAAHYGGQPWFAVGNLVVATTHQVLQFYRRFQLAILDEVDAFPYQGNEMLQFGLQRALSPTGKLVEMTATPRARHSYSRVITIPARYHGWPLPEPSIVLQKLPGWAGLQLHDLADVVLRSLHEDDQPWLVFVPTIAACRGVFEALKTIVGKTVGICHSKDENRVKTVQALKNGSLDIVVTTSVLERGVNFPGVGVVVLYADHGIFSVSALVQIAGRVGRSAEAPDGTVLFVGARQTAAMRGALKLILELNHDARRKGLLKT